MSTLVLLAVAAWLVHATRVRTDGRSGRGIEPSPARTEAGEEPHATDLAPRVPRAGTRHAPPISPPAITETTPLVPLPAATLAYYDRPGVRQALMQLRSATRHRCATLIQFPTGERRMTFRISAELSAAGLLEAATVVPDDGPATECIRKQMSSAHLPAADGPTPLVINLSFLY